LASFGGFRLKVGVKRRRRDDDVKNDFCDDCAPGRGNFLQPPAVGGLAVQAEAFGERSVGVGYPPFARKTAKDGAHIYCFFSFSRRVLKLLCRTGTATIPFVAFATAWVCSVDLTIWYSSVLSGRFWTIFGRIA